MIVFSCPKCALSMKAGDDRAGVRARCKKCAAEFVIPAAGGVAPVFDRDVSEEVIEDWEEEKGKESVKPLSSREFQSNLAISVLIVWGTTWFYDEYRQCPLFVGRFFAILHTAAFLGFSGAWKRLFIEKEGGGGFTEMTDQRWFVLMALGVGVIGIADSLMAVRKWHPIPILAVDMMIALVYLVATGCINYMVKRL